MRVIIAGSRDVVLCPFTMKSITKESGFDITEVVSGTARGVDQCGEEWAKNNSIPISRFHANWDKYKKSAGMIRNKQMADYADALIAVWDGASSGTKNMINNMKQLNKPVFIHLVENKNENRS